MVVSSIQIQNMYTGIVEQSGTIIALVDSADGRRLTIRPDSTMDDLKLGDSINVSGCCLTVIGLEGNCLAAEISHETLRRTKLGLLSIGDRVNLERPVKLNDRLGGHLVSGHVDTLAKVILIKKEGFSHLVTFALSKEYATFFVEKGSVTIDGVSLTVANCDDSSEQFQFSVALIPYTMEITSLGDLKTGQVVNIETDLFAKYLVRWFSLGNRSPLNAEWADAIRPYESNAEGAQAIGYVK